MPANTTFINIRSWRRRSRSWNRPRCWRDGGKSNKRPSLVQRFFSNFMTRMNLWFRLKTQKIPHRQVGHRLFRPTKKSSLEIFNDFNYLGQADWMRNRAPQIEENQCHDWNHQSLQVGIPGPERGLLPKQNFVILHVFEDDTPFKIWDLLTQTKVISKPFFHLCK